MSDTLPRGADRASRLARARDVATQGRRLVYESGEWEIDLARRELRARGAPVPIGSRAFDIIEVLVRSAGELVTEILRNGARALLAQAVEAEVSDFFGKHGDLKTTDG